MQRANSRCVLQQVCPLPAPKPRFLSPFHCALPTYSILMQPCYDPAAPACLETTDMATWLGSPELDSFPRTSLSQGPADECIMESPDPDVLFLLVHSGLPLKEQSQLSPAISQTPPACPHPDHVSSFWFAVFHTLKLPGDTTGHMHPAKSCVISSLCNHAHFPDPHLNFVVTQAPQTARSLCCWLSFPTTMQQRLS